MTPGDGIGPGRGGVRGASQLEDPHDTRSDQTEHLPGGAGRGGGARGRRDRRRRGVSDKGVREETADYLESFIVMERMARTRGIEVSDQDVHDQIDAAEQAAGGGT